MKSTRKIMSDFKNLLKLNIKI